MTAPPPEVRVVALVTTAAGPRDTIHLCGEWYAGLWHGARLLRIDAEEGGAVVAELKKRDVDAVVTGPSYKSLVERLLFEETGDDFRTTVLVCPG